MAVAWQQQKVLVGFQFQSEGVGPERRVSELWIGVEGKSGVGGTFVCVVWKLSRQLNEDGRHAACCAP